MNDDKKVIAELEQLEGRVSSIQELIQSAKSKALVNEAITEEELGLIVERIQRLDVVMRDRQDVGH